MVPIVISYRGDVLQMKRLTVPLIIIAVITSIIGISVAALLLTHRSSRIERSVVGSMPEAPVTVCELIQNPDGYYAKSISVRAVLLGYHELALYDPACKGVDKYVRADFDSALREELVAGIAGLKGAGFKEGNFWAEVLLVGRFEKLADAVPRTNKSSSKLEGHEYIKYRFRFVVLDVAHVGALPSDMTWPP
jgi:hypothetical protein